MKSVILGAGVVGFEIASQLISEGKDVILIEKDPIRSNYVSNHLDCLVLNEEGSKPEILKNAGTEDADFFISVTNSDEVNMIACGIVASEFNVPVKIARVRSLEYSRKKVFQKPIFGIDYIINPNVETARKIANIVALGATSDVMLFEDSDVQMRNAKVDGTSFFKNKKIKDIKHEIEEEFIISAILRHEEFLIPSGDTIIQENDNLYFFATRKTLTNIFIKSGRKSEELDRIVIVGGGTIGTLVAQYLIRTGRKISIIDNEYENCRVLSDRFPEALVLNADISDEDIFKEEIIGKNDLIITTTKNQELNILTAAYAKGQGIKRSIALVTKSHYLSMAPELGIDSTISPRHSSVDAIMKIVRKGNIKNLYSLFDGKAEVIEYSIDANSTIVNKSINQIDSAENALILCVERNNKSLIPSGNFTLREGDNMIIIGRKDSVTEIENILEG
ncbi:Trk system potassium transporter TrkA [Spirochaetota bacterium]